MSIADRFHRVRVTHSGTDRPPTGHPAAPDPCAGGVDLTAATASDPLHTTRAGATTWQEER